MATTIHDTVLKTLPSFNRNTKGIARHIAIISGIAAKHVT